MRTYRYKVEITPESEGGFLVRVPSLRGCNTWGRDEEHALEMAHESAQLYLEGIADFGKPIPEIDDLGPEETSIEVEAPANV